MRHGQRQWIQAVNGALVEHAIAEAERHTSGEIRVAVAPLFWGSVQRAAERAFARLGMARTREHNGVLIFVVPARRSFRVLGDERVHARLGQAFWDEVAAALQHHFTQGEFTDGLLEAIALVGERLAAVFPRRAGDLNQLPDAVSFEPSQPHA